MKLDLKALFGGDTQRIAIEEQLDFHDLQYGSYCPLRQPVRVTGQAYASYLDLDLSFVFDGVCARCAEPIQKPMSLSLHKILVEDLQTREDADDEYVLVQDSALDLSDLLREELLLFFPTKMLCKPDCKGLCCTLRLPKGCGSQIGSPFAAAGLSDYFASRIIKEAIQMAVPKRKTSKARKNKRRSSVWKLNAPTLVKCPNCAGYTVPHKVCANCGYYNGKAVVSKDEA